MLSSLHSVISILLFQLLLLIPLVSKLPQYLMLHAWRKTSKEQGLHVVIPPWTLSIVDFGFPEQRSLYFSFDFLHIFVKYIFNSCIASFSTLQTLRYQLLLTTHFINYTDVYTVLSFMNSNFFQKSVREMF